ncbi:gem-associated protein 5 isoform X2 [Phyllopteryx taeniolatus]|uniref:gem-associated protein 5 isoform X2 n=1 Tax=Phyllopteryx taeniolatus TaxID=161469 RepID=UPI002AD26F84|nr:gem-associated protein 5 isoform X2 [Phyllopteryx taeniolatus]
MHERLLPASPNWYCSRCCDVSCGGLLGVGAKNFIYLIDVSAATCSTQGVLVGHRGLVSGVSFCQDATQSHICASSSGDGVVIFWDTNAKSVLREHASHQSAVSALHWSPLDKNLVVSGDEKGIVMCHRYNTGDTARFFPEPRTIVCLTCSPHTWSTVAVGYKDGMIALIDVSKKGEVTRRLRGHDDDIHSLAWSPLANEDVLNWRADAGDASNGVNAGEEKGCYLASGSKDQTVRVWSTATGKGVTTLKLPYLKRRGSAVDPTLKERLWLNVHWPKGRPAQLVSSCFSGELVMWDLTRTGKQKWTLFGSSSEGQNHSRIVFNTAAFTLPDGRELLVSTSLNREVKCWDLADLDCRWTLPTLGGFVYSLAFSPVATGCLALGVGDNMIRVWNTLSTQNQYDARCYWQGIKSKVTALAWHPKREGTLSFGTDDGKVGIYEVFSSKPPQISSTYHKKTVYSLAWGPPLPPMSFGAAEGKASHSLYSCAGEGVILQHNPTQLSGDACDIDKLIRQTNNIKHKLSPHTDLSWKPDGKAVAIGNEDGCIDVYQAPSLKLLCSIQQHHKVINALRWHPDDNAPPELHGLLASGSCNAIVYVHDLRQVLENPPESPLVLTEPYRRLCGHTAKITGLAWSPHHSARLASASYDGTAQVWDVQQEAALSNYRGHVGYLLCVDWSPVDPDVIWTGGKDFTVQEWRVSKQEFTTPPKGKKMVDLKEKAKQKKKNKKTTEASSPGVIGERVTGVTTATNGQEASDEADEDEVCSASSPVPPPASGATQRKTTTVVKSKDKQDSNVLKRKKARSILPLSTSMDHRPKEDLLQDCLTMASIAHAAAPPAGCVAGQGEHVHLGLFSDRAALRRMFHVEEEAHVEGGHVESAVYLRLWSGDLEGALQLAAERGELSDHLVSMAPMAGYAVWRGAVERYVKQLCLQEQHLKAAAHLLSINQVYEAVHLLRSHKLHREAIALAKARLPEDDPVIKELYTSWAVMLEKDGHFSAAAKCYIAVGDSFDAAKVIARKNDVTSLRTAARLASVAGEVTLAQSLALRCAKDLAAARDWITAQEVLASHRSLLVHRLHLSVAELLCASLSFILPGMRGVGHAWASPGEGGILEWARDIWAQQMGVSGADSDAGRSSLNALLLELQSMESPTPTASLPLTQVLLCLSRHVTRGVLSWLLDDGSELAKELWLASAWLREAADFQVSAALFGILANALAVVHCNLDEEARAAADSLRAWAAYHRLYEFWWRRPGNDVISNGLHPEGSPEEETKTSGELDFDASSLLSEAHAACQAERRATEELQERLAAMVALHGRNLAAHGEQDAEAGQQPEEEETFLSLTAKMSKHQQQLTDIPDIIKSNSRPDVAECCLVLLHLGSSVPECLRGNAEDLLRKYGTCRTLQKVSRRFLN